MSEKAKPIPNDKYDPTEYKLGDITIKREEHYIWVARDSAGHLLDKDQYRNDLFERLEKQSHP